MSKAYVKPGDTIRLKNGHVGTVVWVGMGDFIGDPAPVRVQFMQDGKPKELLLTEDEFGPQG